MSLDLLDPMEVLSNVSLEVDIPTLVLFDFVAFGPY